MNMIQKMNPMLLRAYFLMIAPIMSFGLITLMTDLFAAWEEVGYAVLFVVMLPLMMMLGILGGIDSYKMDFLKLAPHLMILFFLVCLMPFAQDTGGAALLFIIGIIMILMIVQLILSTIATAIYKSRIINTVTPDNSIIK